MAAAIRVEILEELIAGEICTSLDNVGKAAILQIDSMVDAALTLEGEGDVRPVDLYVPITHGGETVGFVFASVCLVAYADVRVFHEANDRGENSFAGKMWKFEILVNALANDREGFCEEEHAFIFGLIADGSPLRVITALLASTCVAAGRLEMAVGDRADPDASPSRRDDQRLDASEDLAVAQWSPVGSQVTKTLAVALAG